MNIFRKQTSRFVSRDWQLRRPSKSIVLRCLAWGTAILSLALIPISQAGASGLLIARGGLGGRLEIKEQDVQVTINNGIAVTEVNQVFLNTESRIVEALYMFPVPNGASVSNFSMIIGGKEMIGEVVEKKRAREIYESYKRTQKDPGLLEQVDYKMFEMRVFPIQPNAEQHIKVTYYQPLDFDHDTATYVYPMATSAKGVEEKTTGRFSMTLDVKSEIPVAEIKSPSHKNEFVVVNHSAEYSRASMEVNAGDLSRDVVVTFKTKRPKTGLDIITSKHPGEDGYFMMSLTAGEELEKGNGGMDYVFIVDISGSMRNSGKLVLSRNAANAFIGSLGTDDRFEVMAFNNTPKMLFTQLTNVTDQTTEQSKLFLDEQSARGGTELRPAVNAAYKYKDEDRELNVVILSDGMTSASEQRELMELIKSAPQSSKVFCVGIGNEVNRPLLKQLAEDAGGLAAFISHGDDFDRQALSFRRKLVHPVATDLQISIDGVPVYDMMPNELPNLYHGSPLRMIGRYKESGTANVKVSGMVMGNPFEQTVELDFPKLDDANPEIDRMWAWYQVQSLMAQKRASGETSELVDKIVSLCEGYSIVSQYASFIVLENDAEYRRWKIQRRNATRIKRDRSARAAVEKQLTALREKSNSQLGPSEKPKSTSRESKRSESKPNPIPQVSNDRSRDLEFGKPASSRNSSSSSSSNSNRSSNSSRSTPSRSQQRQRPSGGGGGGAIDPITGLIAAGMAGAAAIRRRKNQVVAGSNSGEVGSSGLDR